MHRNNVYKANQTKKDIEIMKKRERGHEKLLTIQSIPVTHARRLDFKMAKWS